MRLNRSQKVVLVVGASAMALASLFPPFEVFGGYLGPDIAYSFVSRPPAYLGGACPECVVEVAWGLLWFELAVVILATLLALGRFRREPSAVGREAER